MTGEPAQDTSRFVMTVHPGRGCGHHDDGSFCYSDGDAHLSVPPPRPVSDDPADWTGWTDAGYVTDDGPAR